MRYDGKRILITGASQGIGRYLAVYFAGRGAEVILAARNSGNLTDAVYEILGHGGAARAIPCDLRDPAAVAALADAAAPVDIVIHNAADVTSKPLGESSLEEIESIIRANVIGPLQLTRLLLPSMQCRAGALIVTISSLAGYKPNRTQTVYSVSKRAVNGMADALRAELRDAGVRVLHVAPGTVSFQAPARRGHIPVETFAARLDAAIGDGRSELFMSPWSKCLMRLYGIAPGLMR